MLPLSVKKLCKIAGKLPVVKSIFSKVIGENYQGIQKLKGHDMVKKKMKISENSEFSILPCTKIENSDILEVCLFFQILTIVITQDLKTTKI